MYVKCSGDSPQASSICYCYHLSQVGHIRTTAALPVGLPTAPFTTQPGRSSQLGSSQGHLHHIRIFKLLHAYVKSWSSKVLFQVLLSTEMKEYVFYASGTKKKRERDDCTFGSVISRGEENIWATLCSSGAECSELPACDYFTEVNIPFYPLSAEKRNHSSMCWDLFFILL